MDNGDRRIARRFRCGTRMRDKIPREQPSLPVLRRSLQVRSLCQSWELSQCCDGMLIVELHDDGREEVVPSVAGDAAQRAAAAELAISLAAQPKLLSWNGLLGGLGPAGTWGSLALPKLDFVVGEPFVVGGSSSSDAAADDPMGEASAAPAAGAPPAERGAGRRRRCDAAEEAEEESSRPDPGFGALVDSLMDVGISAKRPRRAMDDDELAQAPTAPAAAAPPVLSPPPGPLSPPPPTPLGTPPSLLPRSTSCATKRKARGDEQPILASVEDAFNALRVGIASPPSKRRMRFQYSFDPLPASAARAASTGQENEGPAAREAHALTAD